MRVREASAGHSEEGHGKILGIADPPSGIGGNLPISKLVDLEFVKIGAPPPPTHHRPPTPHPQPMRGHLGQSWKLPRGGF